MSCCDLTLTVQEEEPISLEIVEATIKPEQDKTVTPTYAEQTVLPDAGMTLGSVTVEPIPDPTERLEIIENGSYDVARIGGVDVEVPQGVFPEGTLEITANGTYDVEQFASVRADVNPSFGFVFDEFDEEGYPTRLRTLGVSTIPPYLLGKKSKNTEVSAISRIKRVIFDDSVTTINGDILSYNSSVEEVSFGRNAATFNGYVIRNCSTLQKITFYADSPTFFYSFAVLPNLAEVWLMGNCEGLRLTNTWMNALNVELYAFPNATAVPTLTAAGQLTHAEGCIIRVPSALLDEWQNAPGWKDLTNVTFEGV